MGFCLYFFVISLMLFSYKHYSRIFIGLYEHWLHLVAMNFYLGALMVSAAAGLGFVGIRRKDIGESLWLVMLVTVVLWNAIVGIRIMLTSL